MASDIDNLIPGQLYRIKGPRSFVYVPETDFEDSDNWTWEIISVPSDSVVMVVKVEASKSSREPYWKVFVLFEEQVLYMGDHAAYMTDVFEHVKT